MRNPSRRQFSKTIAAGSLASVAANGAGKMPTRRLGKIAFEAGILGLGGQRIGGYDQTQANADQVIEEAIAGGLNYIDTAPTYQMSEVRLGEALKGKRDKVFLVAKVEVNARGDVLYQIRDSLRKLRTDYLDCVHIHNVGRFDRWPTLDQMLAKDGTLGGLREAKKQGMIRHIGCTSHMRPARVLKVFETGEIDLFMCTINFVERQIYGWEEKIVPEAQRRNIAVIGMKVLGGPARTGAPLAGPENYVHALRYAFGVPGVPVSIVGLSDPQETRQALAVAHAFKPLNEGETTKLFERGQVLAKKWGTIRGPVEYTSG
jgi:predicted aldo/keto reductase-like oxidoreductase